MKRIALCAAMLGLSSAVMAQEPASAPTAAADTKRALDRNCLTESDSRVVRTDDRGRSCGSSPARVYTREDLRATGAIDLSEALRKLDPSIY